MTSEVPNDNKIKELAIEEKEYRKGKYRAPKMSSSTDFPPETWRIIKVAYESGYFASIDALIIDCKKSLSDCPSANLIRMRAWNEGWDKNRLDEIIEEKKQRTVVEILSDLGMDQAKRLEYLVRGIKASDSILDMIETVKQRIDESGLTVADSPDFLGAMKALQETKFKGLRVMLDALKIASEMAGESAPVKIKQVGGSGGGGSGALKNVELLTDEELDAEYERMKRAGIIDLIEQQESDKPGNIPENIQTTNTTEGENAE